MRVFSPDDLAEAPTLALATAVGGALALTILALLSRSRKATPSLPPSGAAIKVHTLPNRGFLLGDLPEMGRNSPRLHEWLYETSLRFRGEPWQFYLPGVLGTTTVLTMPELIEEVLTQADTFTRGKATNDLYKDLLGDSFIAADGERWYHQRKATAKFFTDRALRTCMTVHMRKNVGQLSDVIDRAVASDSPLEMMPLFQEFAMQTFAELALGINMDIIGTGDTHVLERAIREGSPVVMRRGMLPGFWWKLERWLNIGPERKIGESMRASRAWVNKAFQDSLAAISAHHAAQAASGTLPEATDSTGKSLVELFIEQVSEDKAGLSAEDLPEIILSLVVGAHGTSATSLVWYFLVLMKYPEVEKKLREEMAAKLPNADDDSYVTSDQIAKLVYLEATIKEVLRLYPALPLNSRIAHVDTVIGGSIAVKKGDMFYIPAYTIARLPTVWGEDASEFKPERWINPKTDELIAHPNNKFLTFGVGARMCIGMRLATLELRILVANLVKRYRFSLAQPNSMEHVLAMELTPRDPLVMRWTRNPLTPAAPSA